MKDPANAKFTLYQYADELRERGWLVPADSQPPNREDLVIERILVRHGFTRAMADELLVEMEAALEKLESLSPEEALRLAGAGEQGQGHDHSGR